mmetsp:Transcript_52176/g.113419  ORF Transcript_52176/g.113419 Transcript_52176/m.113419 type:complete len:290 (+) Transcript_52176:1129-1998(+)
MAAARRPAGPGPQLDQEPRGAEHAQGDQLQRQAVPQRAGGLPELRQAHADRERRGGVGPAARPGVGEGVCQVGQGVEDLAGRQGARLHRHVQVLHHHPPPQPPLHPRAERACDGDRLYGDDEGVGGPAAGPRGAEGEARAPGAAAQAAGGGEQLPEEDPGAGGRPAVPVVVVVGQLAGRHVAHRRAGRDQEDVQGGDGEAQERQRGGAPHHLGVRGVPPRRHPGVRALLPHRRDVGRQLHVPDVAGPVHRAVRAVHVQRGEGHHPRQAHRQHHRAPHLLHLRLHLPRLL